jgi:YcxB-like protein
MSTTDLSLQITLSRRDLRKAIYYNMFRAPWFWAIVAIAVIIILSRLNGDPGGLIGAIVGSFVVVLLIPYSTARAGMKSAAVLAPMTLKFSDRGVSAEYINGKNSADWSLVKGASEAIGFIFVKMQRGTFHLVPKNQITAEQADELRKILREHLKRNVSLDD